MRQIQVPYGIYLFLTKTGVVNKTGANRIDVLNKTGIFILFIPLPDKQKRLPFKIHFFASFFLFCLLVQKLCSLRYPKYACATKECFII